jgi:hypothetical protein
MPNIIAITETWLTTNDSDVLLTAVLPDYSLYRADRTSRGGGCAILINNNIVSSKIAEINVEGIESVWVKLCLSFNMTVVMGCVYRRPACDNAAFLAWLHKIETDIMHNSCTFILGDFNLSEIDWSVPAPTNSNNNSALLLEMMGTFGMTQCNCTPTRGVNLLDLCFTNNPDCITNINTVPPLSTSDHDGLFIAAHILIDSPPEPIHADCTPKFAYLYSRADYDSIASALNSIHWQTFFSSTPTIDAAWVKFKSYVHELIALYVPRKKISPNGQLNYPHTLIRLIKLKTNAWSHYRITKSQQALNTFKQLSARVRRETRDFWRRREEKILQNGSLGDFYKYIGKKLNPKSNNIVLLDDEHRLVTPEAIPNCFNNYFSTVFAEPSDVTPPFASVTALSSAQVTFTREAVLTQLSKLKSTGPAGVDMLPPLFMKTLAHSLSAPLSLLFTLSYSTGNIPEDWRQSNVTPVFKGQGSRHCVNNYRPISITVVACRVMEAIVRDSIYNFLTTANLLTPHQYGFRAGRSTATQLIETVNDWTQSLDRGIGVDCIYLDFSKAFDKLSHSMLLTKLTAYGLHLSTIDWIRAFLHNRKQKVKLLTGFSDCIKCSSGVPQGSVLGPLLFLIYVNDLPSVVKNGTIKMYADDAKVYKSVRNNADVALLQSDLSAIEAWSVLWCLPLNIKKCVLFRLRDIPNITDVYVLHGTNLTMVEHVKDLGVYFSKNLNFAYHCNYVYSCASRRLSLMLRSFINRDKFFLTRMFKTYIRPIVEYCSCVWCPHFIKDIDLIESIQRRFTRSIPGLASLPYTTRLERLGLQSLELRRVTADCIFAYKTLHRVFDNSFNFLFTLHSEIASRPMPRNHDLTFYVPQSRLDIRKFSFAVRTVNYWNALTNNTVNARSVAQFCALLHTNNLTHFMKGRALHDL